MICMATLSVNISADSWRARVRAASVLKGCYSCRIMHRPSEARPWRFPFLLKIALFLLWLMGPTWLHSETISGTIQDPSGAVIAGARIEISRGRLGAANLAVVGRAGQLRVSRSETRNVFAAGDTGGFRATGQGSEFAEEAVQLQLTLSIAKQQAIISVPGKSLAFANSDPIYRQLRDIGLGQTFRFDNFTLTWDTATSSSRKGH
jgi:hypothetical protein